jgi:hypothetical protein
MRKKGKKKKEREKVQLFTFHYIKKKKPYEGLKQRTNKNKSNTFPVQFISSILKIHWSNFAAHIHIADALIQNKLIYIKI